jgi:hypothetical protein
VSEYRSVLERAATHAPEPDLPLERVLRRRDRRRRNQRITAGVVGIAVFVAVAWIVTGRFFDRAQTPMNRPTQTPTIGPTETESTYTGPTYTLGPVTKEDIAVGDAFSRAWIEGDGVAAAAMFSLAGTIDGFQSDVLPVLHDWFGAGGWTFEKDGCGVHGWSDKRGVVGCGFTYENDLTRALGMRPVGTEISFVIDAGRIETAWFGGGGECCYNLFGSPDPDPQDPFRPVWDMFVEWLSTSHPENFKRMYDADYGYPIRGYPILDPDSIELWKRYTDEFVAAPEELRRSFTQWTANQSFHVQARRICMTGNEEFAATHGSRDVGVGWRERQAAFYSAVAEAEAEMLAQLRALPLETEADRATMDAFVPLAERMIELHRQQAEAAEAGDHKRLDELLGERIDLTHRTDQILFCMIRLGA